MNKLVIFTLLVACSSSPSVERAALGSLTYEVPLHWSSRDLTTHQRAMVEWTPKGGNERKESVTVVRTDVARQQPGNNPNRTTPTGGD